MFRVVNALTGEELFKSDYYLLALAFQEKYDTSLHPITRIIEEVAV